MIYLFDTNSLSDLSRRHSQVVAHFGERMAHGEQMLLCPPVRYEFLRGLVKAGANAQIRQFHEKLVPLFEWQPLADQDWVQATQFWSDARHLGKPMNDMDLLIAALAYRLDAILITSDADFDPLPLKRENWRLEL